MDEAGLEEQVISRIGDSFFSDGFSGFTMDDVARENGVSKKTLYRVFPSKNDLILMVVSRKISQVSRQQDRILSDSSLDYRGRLNALLKVVMGVLSQVRRRTMEEMARLHPEVWELIRQRRMELIRRMTDVIREGQDEGLVRRDVPEAFITKYFEMMVDNLASPAAALELDMAPGELMENAIKLFFEGVETPAGRPGKEKR